MHLTKLIIINLILYQESIMAVLLSVIPIILLFVLMLGFKMAGHKSAFITFIVTAIIALFAQQAGISTPDYYSQSAVGWAFVEGVLKAIFPILIIILMAIFSYNVLVDSKKIEVIKSQFTTFTDDKGIMVLMLVWGFGGLLEGMAGFGTAVAIPAAILISLGFKPGFQTYVQCFGIIDSQHSSHRLWSRWRSSHHALQGSLG